MLTEENLQDIFEVADLLSNGDRELFIKLKQVVFASHPDDILDYIENILDSLAFDEFLDKVGESEKDNLWLILLTLLEHNDYICVRDKKDRLRDFVHFFDRLQQVRNAGISLKLDSVGLEASGTIPEWASVIDGKVKAEGYCVGAIDRDEHSYTLFFAESAIFDRVSELATKLGYPVQLAQNC